MGEIKIPPKAKLFIGVISFTSEILPEVKKIIVSNWGEVDLESEIFLFNKTDYYKKEMGENLVKKFFSLKKLIPREEIVDIKLKTNQKEKEFKVRKDWQGRDINLDPGYLTLSSVTLATTKDYRHRIYLGKGIYIENTLYYDAKKKSFVEWEWTYPDYRTFEYKEFFNKMREIYKEQLKYGENF
jgi:hypothetical protein